MSWLPSLRHFCLLRPHIPSCFGNKTYLRSRTQVTEENAEPIPGCWPDSHFPGDSQCVLWSYCFLPCLFLQDLVHRMECLDCLSHLEWSFGRKMFDYVYWENKERREGEKEKNSPSFLGFLTIQRNPNSKEMRIYRRTLISISCLLKVGSFLIPFYHIYHHVYYNEMLFKKFLKSYFNLLTLVFSFVKSEFIKNVNHKK